jgi:hypothetical protein
MFGFSRVITACKTAYKPAHRAAPKLLAALVSCLLVGTPCLSVEQMRPVPDSGSAADFSTSYTGLTKKILLAGIEIERFSLSYRLEHRRPSTLQKLVFFGTQETGAACGLAFEISGDQQFNRGRHRPLSVNKVTLEHGLRTAEVGSIIAASGCAYELTANTIRYAKTRRRGFDTKSANQYIASRLQKIDALLSQREALVAANQNQPAHDRAVIEGKILQSMRGVFVNEYAHFSADSRSSEAVENLFYLLNGTYNTLGAIGAGYGYASLNKPKLNGTANILFTISGAIAMAAPLLCSAELWAERKIILHSQLRKWGGANSDLAEMARQRALLEASGNAEGTLMPSLPSTQRLALYTESNGLFRKQLENETTTMRQLNKVALQNSVMGPVIGGLLMTQGILGTHGYYRYFPFRPRKQLDLDYKGAVCGTVGTGLAVVGNAAWMLASLSYEHRLNKQNRLPEQLIKDRLGHLDDLEKLISSL